MCGLCYCVDCDIDACEQRMKSAVCVVCVQVGSVGDPMEIATGVAHLLGHVLGIEHDLTGESSYSQAYCYQLMLMKARHLLY